MYWSAAANIVSYSPTQFDLPAIISSAALHGTAKARMEAFVEAVTIPLERAITDMKTRHPADYAKYTSGNNNVIQVVFVVEGTPPTYEAVSLVPTIIRKRVAITPVYLKRPVRMPEKQFIINGLGHDETAIPYLSGHITRDPIASINASLNAQATKTPAHVSAPFSIVRFDSNGAHWEQQGMCSE